MDASDFISGAEDAGASMQGLDETAQSSTQSVGDSVTSAGKSIQGWGKTLTAGVTAPLAGIGIASALAASDVEELHSKMGFVFEDMKGDVIDWSQTHGDEIGRSEYQLQGYATSLQDTLVPLGFARDDATGLSKDITELGMDLASFNNIAEDDAMDSLQSGIMGNHQALRKFGVVINQNVLDQELLRMGIEGGANAATEAEKAQARYNIITRQTADAHGDAARTSDSLANQWRALKSDVYGLRVEIGQHLVPVVTDLVMFIRELVRIFGTLSPEVQRTVVIVASLVAALGPVLLAIGTMMTLMAPAAAMVSGFASSLTGLLAPGMMLTRVLRGLAIAKFMLINPITLLVLALGALIAMFVTDFANIRTQTMRVVEAFAEHLIPIFNEFGITGNNMLAVLSEAWGQFIEFVEPIFERLFEWIADRLIEAIIWLAEVLPPVLVALGEAFEVLGILIIETMQTLIEVAEFVWPYIRDIILLALELITEAVTVFIEWLLEFWEEHGEFITETAIEIWETVTEAIVTFVEFIVPIIAEFIEWLLELWEEHAEDLMEQAALTWEWITEVIEEFVEFITPLIAEFVEWLLDLWDEHGEELMAIVEFIFETIKGIIELTLSIIVDIIVIALALIRGDFEEFEERIVSIVETLVEAVVGFFQWLYDMLIGGSIIPDMIEDIISAIEEFVTDFLSTVSEFLTDVYNEFADRLQAVRDRVDTVLSFIVTEVGARMREFVSAIEERLREAYEYVSSIMSDMLKTVRGYISDFRNAGRALISALARGIRSAVGRATSAVTNVTSKIRDALPFSDAKEGPLSDLSDTGPAFVSTIADGIRKNTPKLENAAFAAAAAMNPNTQSPVVVQSAADKVQSELRTSSSADGTNAEQIAEAVGEAVERVLNRKEFTTVIETDDRSLEEMIRQTAITVIHEEYDRYSRSSGRR